MDEIDTINSFLDAISSYIEEKYNTVVLRRIIMPSNNGHFTSYIFVPVQFKGFLLEKNLSRSNFTYIDIIDDIKDELGHSLGDAGIIKMSYVSKGFDNENMSVSDDRTLTPDIYEKLGAVSYAKIKLVFN